LQAFFAWKTSLLNLISPEHWQAEPSSMRVEEGKIRCCPVYTIVLFAFWKRRI
jgi:hypothetical protein